MSIYKDCDIRGIYPKEITSSDSYGIGRALATLSPGRVLVGGDLRLSTPELKDALIRGLLDSGAQVSDLGTIPTPALYFALHREGASAGMTVTASHNPPEYNGIKYMIGQTPVTRQAIDELKACVEDGAFHGPEGAKLERIDILAAYRDSLLKRFEAEKPLHILVDAGNGCMSRLAPEVLRAAGYRVTELFCEPDGSFPNRSPDPSNFKNLDAARRAVRESGADFGVAFDGDGDRAVFLNERGEPIKNERSLILFIRHLLKDEPTPVVFDQKSSSAVRDAILSVGGTPVPERSGHAFIKHRFLELGARVAGEVSGHFFFGELGYDDALFAALTMAEIVAASGTTLGALTDAIFLPPVTPDMRLFCAYADQARCLELAENYAISKGASISHLDGVRADLEDGWFLIRKSVTAEQITFRAEAGTEERLREIVREVAACLPEEQGSKLNY